MITYYLRIAYLTSLIICTLFALYQWKRAGLQKQNGLSIYLVAVLFTEIITLLVVYITKKDPSIVYNFAIPFHLIALALFYSFEWKKRMNKTLHLMTTSMVMLIIFYFLSTSNLNSFIHSNGVVLSLYYIFCALHWFFYQINSPDEVSITAKMPFWISIGLISWAVLFIFRLVLKDYLHQVDDSLLTTFQIILSSCNVVVYVLFIKGLSCLR